VFPAHTPMKCLSDFMCSEIANDGSETLRTKYAYWVISEESYFNGAKMRGKCGRYRDA